VSKDYLLAEICAAEAHPIMIPFASNAHSWEPAPKTIRDIPSKYKLKVTVQLTNSKPDLW
jgi:hypothetical protein